MEYSIERRDRARAARAAFSCARWLRVAPLSLPLPLLALALALVALLSSTAYLESRMEGVEERVSGLHARAQLLWARCGARGAALQGLEAEMSVDGEEPAPAPAPPPPSADALAARWPAQEPAPAPPPSADALAARWPALAALRRDNQGSRAVAGLAGGGGAAAHVLRAAPAPAGARAPRPAYRLRSPRAAVDTVIGVPTVRRHRVSYLHLTLKYLIKGLTDAQRNDTLIIVFVGETDLSYVLNTAIQIEKSFPAAVARGLLEVVSPAPQYYRRLDARPPTLGDSPHRFRWRTKQNLDMLYLMAHALPRGDHYLMLEDDVRAAPQYMTQKFRWCTLCCARRWRGRAYLQLWLQQLRRFRRVASAARPGWLYLQLSRTGAIAKLFRAAALARFLAYLRRFHRAAPLDWLLDGYLADKLCGIAKFSEECKKRKEAARPRCERPLFGHAGRVSSLSGQLRSTEVYLGRAALWTPHANPAAARLHTTLRQRRRHSLARAYRGDTFFLAERPRAGDLLEIWFERPTTIERYLIRTGNAEHRTARLYEGVVEALPANGTEFAGVGAGDERGRAEGELRARGPLRALRLRLTRDSPHPLLISEIDLQAAGSPAAGSPAAGSPGARAHAGPAPAAPPANATPHDTSA